MNCEHRVYGKQRCRKRATVVIGYLVPFGLRVGPHGDEQCYQQRITRRCPNHTQVDGYIGDMDIKEYERLLKEQES